METPLSEWGWYKSKLYFVVVGLALANVVALAVVDESNVVHSGGEVYRAFFDDVVEY